MFWPLLRYAQDGHLRSNPSFLAAPGASAWLRFFSLCGTNLTTPMLYADSPRRGYQRSTDRATSDPYEPLYRSDRIETTCAFLVFDSASLLVYCCPLPFGKRNQAWEVLTCEGMNHGPVGECTKLRL